MSHRTNIRASGASPADAGRGPQPNVSLASARPSPVAEAHGDRQPAPHADTAQPLHKLDVSGRIAMLREAFERHTRQGSRTGGEGWRDYASHAAQQIAANRSRLVKVAVGVLLLVAVGWLPVRTLLQTTSTEAIINARLITLRAPIEGEVVAGAGAPSVGTRLKPGATVLTIVNARAERGRLDDLHRLIDQLDSERLALTARRDDLQAMHKSLTAQTRAFMDGRVRQLEARMGELSSEIAAAAANREEAARALGRASQLAASKTISSAAHEKARRDLTVATETHAALGHRLAGVKVEADALRKGVFIGDSYNDRPQSSQRAGEIAQRLSEVTADLREREARLASLRVDLAAETKRYSERAEANLTAPVQGSVWEVMTAPGETVVRGQELVRLLDCSGVVVTATVGETAYNRLRMGDPARFRLRGGSHDYKGRIIGLTGVAAAPANLAIQPSALAKEPYRVTVALPDLATPGQCDVGRTGRVTFQQ